MAQLLGMLNLNDSQREYVNVVGQRVVYDSVRALVERYNTELANATSLLVAETTEDHKRRFMLPGGGYMYRQTGNITKPPASKTSGSWDVAFPLEGFEDQIAVGRVDYSYMTVQDMDTALQNIMLRATNTRRYEMLKRLFTSTQQTFVDPRKGSLAIEGLANGDSVLYPPTVTSESEATDNHYLSAGYASSAISDTNNPIKTMIREVEEHFGYAAGGRNMVVFINSAQTDKISALTDFNDIPDRYIQVGANADVPTGLPTNLPASSKLIGRTDSGAWVAEWDLAIPADYALGIHLEVPAPLVERVDPRDTGLGTGLQLVAKDMDYPLESSIWSLRFGYGVANRLNGVAMFISASAWTTPAAYA